MRQRAQHKQQMKKKSAHTMPVENKKQKPHCTFKAMELLQISIL
jgi:hypothetical protein